MLCSLAAAAATSSELESLIKQAGQNFETNEGRRYLERFQKGIMPTFGKALDTCSTSMPDTKEPASIVFVVAADGTVKRLLTPQIFRLVDALAQRSERSRLFRSHRATIGLSHLELRIIITKNKQDLGHPWTNRPPRAARSR
jgi:hypothetical protein